MNQDIQKDWGKRELVYGQNWHGWAIFGDLGNILDIFPTEQRPVRDIPDKRWVKVKITHALEE